MKTRTLRERIQFTVSPDRSEAAVAREAKALEEAIADAVARLAGPSMARGERAVGPMRLLFEQDVEVPDARS